MKTKEPFMFDTLESNILGIEFRGKPFEFLMNLTKNKAIQLSYIDAVPPLLSENWHFTT